MTKLAYINDHRYLRYKNRIYSSGSMTAEVWERFFPSFDRITVFSSVREANENEVKDLNEVTHDKVQFIDVGYISSVKQFINNQTFLNRQLMKQMQSYDAAIARVPGNVAFNATRICEKLNIPLGLEVVGCPFDAYWNYGKLSGKLLAPISYLSMKASVKRAGYLVYVTKYFLQSRYPTIEKSINASNVNIKCIVDSDQIKANTKAAVFKIGLMGSMNVGYKGHAEALKALSAIKSALPPFLIEFVGPGNGDWCKKLAVNLNLDDEVRVVGKLKSGAPVVEWLDSLDLYIHPSMQEGLPRSVIEAMSRGKPILASSVAGTPELISPEYLHKPGDWKVLAEHLLSAINSEDQRYVMALSNLEASKNYLADFLSNKRKKFWSEFKSSISN